MSINTSKSKIKDMSVINPFGFNSSNSSSDPFSGKGNSVENDLFGGEEKSVEDDLFNGGEKSVENDLFGGRDSKSCFSTPKRLTRQYANPPSLKKKSILDDKKEYTIESPEGKEILNDPGEVKEVDGKTIVFNSTCPWEQEAYIVLPDTNPLTNTVKAIYSNLMKERKESRMAENMLNQEINAVKKQGLEALVKQEYVLKKEHARKDYARKRRRITTNLNDEFTKATGYSTFGDFGSSLFK